MKRIFLLIILVINYHFFYCQNVDEELARKVASNFYQSLKSSNCLKSKENIQLQRVNLKQNNESIVEDNFPLYVFNVGNNEGFVVVSGYFNSMPIFAYSKNGKFPEDNNHPIHLLLNIISSYINDTNSAITNKKWKELESAMKSTKSESTFLIKSKWHQNGPYNIYLSNYLNTIEMEVGCGAIAVAQIMNYYNYPLIGEGSISYDEFDITLPNPPSYGIVSANFEDEYYDWNFFEDQYARNFGVYSDENGEELVGDSLTYAKAMSKTIFEISASLKTTYGDKGGGSHPQNMPKSMETYFGYSSIEKNNGTFISQESWINILKNEIDNRRPVLYSLGGNLFTDQGHAFICDGYDEENFFHFNFGHGQYYSDSWFWMPIDSIYLQDNNYSFDTGLLSTIYTNIKPDYVTPAQDKYEVDNTFETSKTIESFVSQLHSISPVTDKDYFTFTLEKASEVTIETKGVNGNTQIWLYDESKSYLAYDDDSSNEGNGNAMLAIELPAGKYYFMVDEKGNDSTIPSYIISYTSIPIGTRNISFSDYLIKDGSSDGGVGDGDRKVESGERIELDVELFNSGDTNAQDVRAILSTNDPDITIIDNELPWGRINPGEGDWSSDFEFKVSYSCPSKNVTFTLKITSKEGEWTDSFIIPVYNVPTVFIPDANFEQALIDEEIDTDGVINQSILLSDAESVTDDLDLGNRNISSLKGLDAFKNIQRLYCEYNLITELDISKNKDLYYLHCEGNQLKELDISKNPNLTKIKCASNQIEFIDLRNNLKLEYLSCSNNPIEYLDISNNKALTILHCNGTQLRSLNLRNNLELLDLGCDGNKLQYLDLSKNTKLTNLECDDNLLTSLDLSQNSFLIELYCRRNQITQITFTQNSTLTTLECESNKLSSLDISKNSALTDVECSFNELISLDASMNHHLTKLRCASNQLFYLDMRNGINPDDIDLRAENNNLTCINVDDENNEKLKYWDVDDGVVFSENCPKDLDGDGVLDDLDFCPNTPLGEVVNENGCSELQLDDIPPYVTISSSEKNPTNSTTLSLGFLFTEEVTGFDLSDINLNNCTASNLQTQNNVNFTLDLMPIHDGIITVSLPGNSVSDLAGNGNNESGMFSINFDGTAPTAEISCKEGGLSSENALIVTILFNEEVTGFELSDINNGNCSVSNLQTNNNIEFTVDVDPLNDGTVTICIAENAVTDLAGNGNIHSEQWSLVWTGIETLKSLGLKLYPNPVKNYLTVESSVNQNVLIKVFNTEGRVLISEKFESPFTKRINFSNFPNGLYHVHFIINGIDVTHKIILNRKRH